MSSLQNPDLTKLVAGRTDRFKTVNRPKTSRKTPKHGRAWLGDRWLADRAGRDGGGVSDPKKKRRAQCEFFKRKSPARPAGRIEKKHSVTCNDLI
jgi:hypothetical protein